MCSLAVALFGVSKLDLLQLIFSLRPFPVIQVEIYDNDSRAGLELLARHGSQSLTSSGEVGEDGQLPLEKQEESAWAGSHFLFVLVGILLNCERWS